MKNCLSECSALMATPGSDALATLVQIAGLLGLAVATLSALVGLRSYLESRRIAADSHMHSLFREYLQLRLKLAERRSSPPEAAPVGEQTPAAPDPSVPIDDPYEREFHSIKNYILEEMFAWLASNWPPRRWSLGRLRRPYLWSRTDYDRRVSTMLAWKRTIEHHLEKKADFNDLTKSHQCYGADYLRFAANALGHDELNDKASIERPWEPLLKTDRAGQP